MGRLATADWTVRAEAGLAQYFREIRRFPMLEPGEESLLARHWRERGDRGLVNSHLRLIAKIAMGYHSYGLPIADVISEGNVDLLRAVQRFDPELGFRLTTYAVWWIRASIQEYILRSWSMVRIGTTANQKKLFFNLQKAKRKISAFEERDLQPDQIQLIARRLGVKAQDVIDMNGCLCGDASLNAPVGSDCESDERQERLVDETADQEIALAEREEFHSRRQALADANSKLNVRERRIIEARQLAEEPVTLKDLAGEFRVSRERVRQIGLTALAKVQKTVKNRAAMMKSPASIRGH